jgi:hypothetical protein
VKPLAIDLYCGLGGWTEGLLAEGYDVIGFDIERHRYGEHCYPAQLVLQDVLTLHGSQFKDAALIVASPPCQEYSYMAMPWSLAKQRAGEYRDGTRKIEDLNRLFDAAIRIGAQARVPTVIENVRGAIPWVGRSRWNYGSYHLWGDVPALMPMTVRRDGVKVGGIDWSKRDANGKSGVAFTATAEKRYREGQKTTGHVNKRAGASHTRHLTNQSESDGVKGLGIGSVSWGQGAGQRHPNDPRNFWSKSDSRKAASAVIAKIPLPLARHIAAVWFPR